MAKLKTMKTVKALIAAFPKIFLIIIFFCTVSVLLLASERKVRVIAEKASIYFKADKNSPVVATVPKGTILSLHQAGKIKKYGSMSPIPLKSQG